MRSEQAEMNSRTDARGATERKQAMEILQESADDFRPDVELDERKRAETLLAGENRLLEMVAKGESLPSILEGICRLVEEISNDSLCSILLLDANGDRLWHGAAPSLPASYTSAFGGKTIGPTAGP